MTLKAKLQPYGARLLTSDALRDTRRALHSAAHRLRGRRTLEVFLAPDDPYSYLLAHYLPKFVQEYGLDLAAYWVRELPAGAVPEPERLAAWALRDACWLAEQHGLPMAGSPPSSTQAEAWTNAMAAAQPRADELPGIFDAIWSGKPAPAAHSSHSSHSSDTTARKQHEAHLVARGHYWPGMCHYQGEWYWGLDRLEHLRARLERRDVTPRRALHTPTPAERAQLNGQAIELFWSARSPYSYLVLDRMIALAQRWQLPLTLRPVLPMVMRNLPVPRDKRLYIVLDTKREADRAGLDFGFLCDPLGAATERCYAILMTLEPTAQLQFASSFARGVWAEGIGATTKNGIDTIAQRAGVRVDDAARALEANAWREQVERNRQDLLEAGGWGVPVMRWNGAVYWGQDRVEMLEDALRANAAAQQK